MTWTTSKRWAGFVGGAIAAGAVLVAAGTPRATEGALAQAARVARIAASDDATAAELGWSVETLRAAREARGASNAGLLQSSAVQRGKALKRIGNPKPEAAPEGIRWRAMALLDENGEVPEGGLLAAKAQIDAMGRPSGSSGRRPGRRSDRGTSAGASARSRRTRATRT